MVVRAAPAPPTVHVRHSATVLTVRVGQVPSGPCRQVLVLPVALADDLEMPDNHAQCLGCMQCVQQCVAQCMRQNMRQCVRQCVGQCMGLIVTFIFRCASLHGLHRYCAHSSQWQDACSCPDTSLQHPAAPLAATCSQLLHTGAAPLLSSCCSRRRIIG